MNDFLATLIHLSNCVQTACIGVAWRDWHLTRWTDCWS